MPKLEQQWFAILAFCAAVLTPMPSLAANAPYISEVAWAGSSLSASDEWIEFTNPTNQKINLAGWSLTGAGGTDNTITFPDGTTLQPNAIYLLANYGTEHENSSLTTEPNFVTASVSLPNNGFHLTLHDTNNAIIDVAGGSGTPFAGGSGDAADTPDGRYTSMVRVDAGIDGGTPEAWSSATSSQNLKTSVNDYAHPGVTIPVSTPTETETVESTEETSEKTQEVTEEETSFTPTLAVNEILATPGNNQHEWIELINNSDTDIDLTNWTVEDAAGKTTALEGFILANNFYLIKEPNGKLNNDGDDVILKDQNGLIQLTFSYATDAVPKSTNGQSIALIDGTYTTTFTPTPGQTNIYIEEKPETEETTEEESTHHKETATEETTHEPNWIISEFLAAPDEQEEEWIELQNLGDATDITEWTIEDESGKQTILSGYVEQEHYFLIEKPSGVLNNDGDTITLKDKKGTVITSLTYGTQEVPTGKKGESVALDGDLYLTTTAHTPGTPNLIFHAIETIEEAQEIIEEVITQEEVETTQSQETQTTEEPTQTEQSLVLNKQVELISLYPNTSGSDEKEEYITLKNTSTEHISLKDWKLVDATNKGYTFSDETIDAGSTLELSRTTTKIALNNTGDTVQLIAPDETIVEEVVFGKATQGQTYDKTNGAWDWSQTNAVLTQATPTETNNVTSTTVTSSYVPSVSAFTVEELTSLANGTNVQVTGSVTALPGQLGKQIFYMEDETGGTQVYLYSAQFPTLHVGEVITVTGELSTSHGEQRVKLSTPNNIKLQNSFTERYAPTLLFSEMTPEQVGNLVTVSGLLQTKSSTKLVLENQGEVMDVHLGSTSTLSTEQFQRGDELHVTGVISTYNGSLRIRPRTQEDIQVIVQETEEVTPAGITDSQNKNNFWSNQKQTGTALLLVTFAMFMGLALTRLFPKKKLAGA